MDWQKKSKLRLVRMREKQIEKFAFFVANLIFSRSYANQRKTGPKEELVKNAVFRYSPAVTKGLNLQKFGKYRIPLFFSFSCFQSPLRRRLISGVAGNKNMERIITRQRPDSPPPQQGTPLPILVSAIPNSTPFPIQGKIPSLERGRQSVLQNLIPIQLNIVLQIQTSA